MMKRLSQPLAISAYSRNAFNHFSEPKTTGAVKGFSFVENKRPSNLDWDRVVVFRKGMII